MSALLVAALLSPAWAQAAPRRITLAVGANDGGDGRATLRYAHDDARAIRDVLVAMGGVAPADGRLLLDPSVAELRATLDAVAAEADGHDARTEVVFYYSGHSDEQGLLLGEERFPYADLRGWMDGLDAKVRLAVLDSCSSGALIRAKGGQKVAPFLVDEGTNVDGLAYITSSSRDEVSQEADQLGGSYFTHFLTMGLRGAADRSGDSRVSLTEAYTFARDATLERTERTRFGAQHANHEFDLSGSGDLVLTDLSATEATLVLDAAIEGRVVVRDDRGALFAELDKRAGRAVELALPAGPYQVTWSGGDAGGQYGVVERVLDVGASEPLAESDFRWYDTESAVARGDAPVARLEGQRVEAAPEPIRAELWPGMPAGPAGATDELLFGLVGARAERLDGGAAAFGVIDVVGRQQGVSVALGATSAGELGGAQLAIGANRSRGGVSGVQAAVGGNVAAGPAFEGVQAAVGLNVLRSDRGEGAQLASAVNVARGRLHGAQSAPLNVAEALSGVQFGVINVGRDVEGAQIGVINVARDVAGAQVGLINVARDVRGAPVGLLSFERDGRHDLLLYASEADWLNGEVRLGGDVLYTVLGGGGTPGASAYGAAGLGVHAPFAQRLWLDVDASAMAVLTGPDPFAAEPPTLGRARVSFGGQVAKEFAPFVGVSFNVGGPYRPGVGPTWASVSTSDLVTWPGVFGGVQF